MPALHCENIHYPSADGRHTVAAYLYTVPGVPVRAVIQLSHGMTEYVGRYKHVAAFYAERGIAFAGNDHLGHGYTVTPEERGHYGEKDGRKHLLRDLHTMNTILHERFPGLPVILYGHSMGSFYARWYAEVWPDSIHALIISGTAGPDGINKAGQLLSAAIAAVRGNSHISPLVLMLAHGNYNDRFGKDAGPDAWLSRDEAFTVERLADDMGGFHFTVGTYREMLATLNHVSTMKWAEHMRKSLPILLTSGADDPVGGYGAGVRKVYHMLQAAGVKDVTCQIWEGGRHEMHNETNRQEFFYYCLGWIEEHIE